MVSEYKAYVLEYVKVRNILCSSLDNVMSNKVFGYKTLEEIWDTMEVRCQGKKAIKNKRTIFI